MPGTISSSIIGGESRVLEVAVSYLLIGATGYLGDRSEADFGEVRARRWPGEVFLFFAGDIRINVGSGK
jgi:hypothetical protein